MMSFILPQCKHDLILLTLMLMLTFTYISLGRKPTLADIIAKLTLARCRALVLEEANMTHTK